MMSSLDKEAFQTLIHNLEEMVNDGAIDAQWYHKALVDGAHQHLVNKELNDAITLLGKVPSSYFAEVIKTHMTEDPAYASQVYDIAMVLVNNHLVHLKDVGTVPPAEA